MSRKVVIVGGVAGGATCAARLRRLDENAKLSSSIGEMQGTEAAPQNAKREQ